ncbi:MAG: hypothetical protein JXR42_00155 [Gammaproteobacteria bacterium]|nr:hypothetical protein [Gammaproteobacteria bacterium]
MLTINDEHFVIDKISCKNYGISQSYVFNIEFSIQKPINIEKIINQQAIIKLDGTNIYGIVNKITSFAKNYSLKPYSYKTTIKSPLTLLDKQPKTRSWLNKSIIDLLNEILKTYPIKYKIICTENYQPSVMHIQNNETDNDFLLKKVAYYGLIFVFDKNELIISDDIKNLSSKHNIDLAYDKLHIHSKLITKNIELHTYQSENASEKLFNKKEQSHNTDVRAYGTKRIYGKNYLDFNEGEKLAKIIQEQYDHQRYFATLKTSKTSIKPSSIINITNHPIGKYNKEYLVINANIHSKTNTTLTMIPSSIPFRAIFNKKGNIPTIQTASIERINKNGLYETTMELNYTKVKTKPLRGMQTYSGDDYGFHCHLNPGDKVAIAFTNNDIEQPMILGAIHTKPATTHGILNENNHIMIDPTKDNGIEIKNAENKININKNIIIDSAGKFSLSAKQNILLKTNNEYILKCKKNLCNLINYKFTINAGDINISSKQNIKFTTQNNIEIMSNILKTISINCKISAKNKTMIKTKKDTNFIGNRYLQMHAKKNIKLRGNKNIKIIHPKASISINTSGDITIKAQKIIFNFKHSNLQSIPTNFSSC